MRENQAHVELTEQLTEYIACNLCGANDYTIVYPSIAKEGELELKAKFAASSQVITEEQVVRCRKCGLVYVNPRFRADIILRGYEEADNTTYVSQREGRISTSRKAMEFIQHYVSSPGRILDVGCAGGFFLMAARECGWETYGIEPSRWLVEYARRELGLETGHGTLKDGGFPDEYFDVITYWDVMEHTSDPRSELRESWRILKPGGIILISCPDFSSIWAKVLRRRWWFLLSVHLYYFTPTTLTAMLQAEGFESLARRMHFQQLSLGYLVYRLEPYSKWAASLLNGFVKLFGWEDKQLTYYASQMNIIARKMDSQ